MAVSNVTLPNGERVNISHEDDASELDVLNFAYREYVTNTDPGSAFGRGIRDGVDLLQASYGSTLEGIGSLLDSESLQQVGADVVAEQRGQMDAEAFRQQRYGDQDEGIVDYALNLAGASTPQMASTFAGAGAGAAIGAGFFGVGALPGAIIGGFLANMPYFYGDNRERQKEAIERGFRTEMDEGAAALYAVPQSLLDAAFSALGTKFLSSGALKAGGGLLTRATRGAVEGAIIEAPTELGQQFLNRYQAGLPIDSDEAKLEYMEAAKGGALLGGLFSGGGRAVFGSKEGPDAMPAPAEEETVQMPPSVTAPEPSVATPEGEAVSPEVGDILEAEQAPQSELTPEDEAAIDTEIDATTQQDQQGIGDRRFEDNVAVEEADYILPDVELDDIARLDVGQLSDEELQKLIESYNTYDNTGDRVRNLDYLQQFAERFNRDLDKNNKKYNAERKRIARAIKERDARSRGEVSQLSEADFDALAEEAQRKRGRGGSPEAQTEEMLTAQEEAALEAEMQREFFGEAVLTVEDEAALDAEIRRELSGDTTTQEDLPVATSKTIKEFRGMTPKQVEEARFVDEQAKSAPVTAPPQEVDSEAVKEQQDTIDDAESRIADLQSEIDTEKSNIKEARDRNKKEIAAVRKSKLSKEDKADKIEDLKASLQDEVDDINGNIGIYKEEMSSFKKDLRKAKKELDKLNTAAQGTVSEAEKGYREYLAERELRKAKKKNIKITAKVLSNLRKTAVQIAGAVGSRTKVELTTFYSKDEDRSATFDAVNNDGMFDIVDGNAIKGKELPVGTVVDARINKYEGGDFELFDSRELRLKEDGTWEEVKDIARLREEAALPKAEGALTEEELVYILGQMDGDLTVGADGRIIPFTDEEAFVALPSNQKAKHLLHRKNPIKKGAVRLNLNSKFYKKDGVVKKYNAEQEKAGIPRQEGAVGPLFVQTLHRINRAGVPEHTKAYSYGRAFTIRNATFSVNPFAKTIIRSKAKNKYPMASVDGDIVADAEPNLGGEVLSFNPFVHDSFVDSQGRTVIGADEITVYGTKGYARGNIQYSDTAPEVVTASEILSLARQGKKYVHPNFHPNGIDLSKLSSAEIEALEALAAQEDPDSAPLTEQDVQDGKEGEQGLVVDTPVTGDVVAGADLIQPGGPVSVPNAPVISRSSLRDKNGFIYFSDRTRVGTYTGLDPESNISIPLQGGMGYAFIPQNVEAEAGWAFTSDNIFTRFRDKVNQTDGIGYVALYTKENLRANGTFLLAYIAEVEYALASGKLTRADFQNEINGLRERFLAKKVKDKDFISRDVDWYSLWNKQWKTPADLQAALDAAGFETRAAAFSAKKATTKGAKPGDLSGGQLASKRSVKKGMPDVIRMIDLFAEPDLANRKRGEIIGAVQFQKGQQSAVTASEIGSDNHLSYPLVIRGRGIGVFDSTVNVLDVIKTQKAKNQALRSAETSFPTSSEVGSAEVTAGTDTGPEIANIINEGKTFENVGQLERFINKVFAPVASKLGVKIVANYSIIRALQYNVTQGVIEYNPVGLINNDSQYLTASMREELIHAAMHKVLINQNKGKSKVAAWVDFMTKLGQDLTGDQRQALSEVYFNLGSDMDFGAEYSRAVIQQALYGDITEVYAKGKSFEKIKKLFRSIQGFIARTFGSEVSNPEVAGVIRASADLLKAVDPSVRPSNQVVVGAAMNNSVDLNPNSEITSQDVVEAGKPPSKRKVDLNFADKYLFTVSYVLGKIHPRLKGLIRNYYGIIQTKVLAYQTAMAPFFVKMRGIKNKSDRLRLKQLLMYSPVVADAGTAEQEALLAKYGMLEDYNNLVRPSLDKLRADLVARGVDVGDLFDYFPRRIKNFKALQAVKAAWGNTVGASFKDFIKARNDRILKVRSDMLTLNEELVKASDNNDQAGVQRISRQLKELSAKDDVIISIGSKETALQEAQAWEEFTSNLARTNPDMLPGNVRERAMKDQIPDELLQYYEDPAQAMESYIFNMVSAAETIKLIGSRFVTNKEGTQMDEASELGKLVQELRASGAIIDEQADRTIPEIMKLILSPKKGESRILQLARSFGYGTLLVEFTSTLSQLYDLPFVMLDNGLIPTFSAMFSSERLKGSAFGIDTEKISQEFAGDDKFLEKAVRLGLRSTGFTKLDQIMKETNLTANYRRFRKLANLYYKDRSDSRIKTFTAEMTALGYSRAEQDQLIADLKGDKKDSALVRSLLFNKLSETQPLSSAEMAMGIVGNPNLRIAVAMKSFMVKQLVFTKDRMLNDIVNPKSTNAQRLKASKDLAKLLTFMLLIGIPVDALKDFLAGRVGYLDDYLFDGVFRIAGVSRYTGYKIRSEGIGRAAFDYATPVAFQQAMDATGELQKVMSGERAFTQSKFVAYAPYSDVVNRMFGFQKVKERKTIKRKASEGEFPLFIPPGAL